MKEYHIYELFGICDILKFIYESLPMCGFIAQLVEHRTGIAEVTGSNPVEALIFVRLLLSDCLNWKYTVLIILYFHKEVLL